MKRYFNIALLSLFLTTTTTHTIASAVGAALGRTAQRVGPAAWKAAKWSTAVGLPPGAVLLFEIIGEKKAQGEEADFTVKELATELGIRTRYAILGCKSLMEDFAKGLGDIDPDDIPTSFVDQAPTHSLLPQDEKKDDDDDDSSSDLTLEELLAQAQQLQQTKTGSSGSEQ